MLTTTRRPPPSYVWVGSFPRPQSVVLGGEQLAQAGAEGTSVALGSEGGDQLPASGEASVEGRHALRHLEQKKQNKIEQKRPLKGYTKGGKKKMKEKQKKTKMRKNLRKYTSKGKQRRGPTLKALSHSPFL